MSKCYLYVFYMKSIKKGSILYKVINKDRVLNTMYLKPNNNYDKKNFPPFFFPLKVK